MVDGGSAPGESAASDGFGRLSEDLVASAQAFCRSSLQALAADDGAVFLLHAGTALEHLSKSLLASLHGSLIARPDEFNSLLHASGLGKYASTRPTQMRTITLTVSLQRAGQIVPELANLKEPLQPLVDGRNGVAHAALVDRDVVEDVVVPFLRSPRPVAHGDGYEARGVLGRPARCG